jgi:hypothetical protein
MSRKACLNPVGIAMTQDRPNPPRELPRWAVALGSIVIGLHLLAVGMLVLSTSSGPWPTRFGESMADGPYFAIKLNRLFFSAYLEPLRLTHTYHYASDRPLVSAVWFEGKLKNANGDVFKTVKIPEESANFSVRHRQHLIAMFLGNDQPVQAPRAESISAPGQKMRQVSIWEGGEANTLRLIQKEEHLVPKDRPVMRPTDWSLILARSYQRYLNRRYKADAVELVRHSKEPVMPGLMFLPRRPDGTLETPPETFSELISTYGESREK